MTGMSAKDVNLFHLGMREVSYPAKDIHTMALEVLPENIGALSLELRSHLRYYADTGTPYIVFWAERKGDENSPVRKAELLIRPGDWIVIVWDEIHIFRDAEFRCTFRMDTPAPHVRDYPVVDSLTPEPSTWVRDVDTTKRDGPQDSVVAHDPVVETNQGFLSDYH